MACIKNGFSGTGFRNTLLLWYIIVIVQPHYGSAEEQNDQELGISAAKKESIIKEFVNSMLQKSNDILEPNDGEAVQPNNIEAQLNSTDELKLPNDNLTSSVDVDANKTTTSAKHKRVTCLPRNETNISLTVQIIDESWTISLQEYTRNNLCFAVLFYTQTCHFSASAAPHYNALPRSFPDVLCLAIDASAYTSLNARLGIIGLPTLMLFHGGQPVAKFNDSQYTLERFASFITKYTGLTPIEALNVTSADFEGPLSNVVMAETDPLLWLAWIFVILCCSFGITKSSIFNRVVEALRNNWHEAEAQHQHAD